MTAEILQGPGSKGGGAGPWPSLDAGDVRVDCGALFIDLRGSSNMPGAAGKVAARARDFLNITREIWEKLQDSEGAPPPKSIRLVGDGLFCVWEAEGGGNEIMSLPRYVLSLFEKLPDALQERWASGEQVKIGMGLAFGEASKCRVGGVDDYYGYTINLASKLQNFARPQGLVIGPPEYGSLEPAFVLAMKQSERLFERSYPLPMAHHKKVSCLVTRDVDEIHEWTCLAWPGFAVSRGEDGKRLGLNARGITVLTHEGLRGKIDSLRIWPRNGYDQAEADQFEFIIDDFDSLEAMRENEVIKLSPLRGRELHSLVAPALRDAVMIAGLPFTPIRCGLNAVAWHNKHGAAVKEHTNYRETIELAGRDSEFIVAMYDNVGASLPILLDAFCPKLGAEIFSFENPVHLQTVIDELAKIQPQDSDHRLFQVYGEIEMLAGCLQAAQVHAVLGGGAWLANLELTSEGQKISTHIPDKSRGFLWMEGAALLEHLRAEAENLRDFLRDSVLTDVYQNALMEGLSYCSCPVTRSLISKILADDPSLEDSMTSAKRLVFEDTKRIFEDSETISKRVSVRRCPALADQWDATWHTIKQRFCRQIGA